MQMKALQNIKAVLIDLSGTLHIENAVTPDAINALKKLKDTKLKLKFVTNTTKESKKDLHDRLNKLGFKIKKDEIFSSLTAAYETVQNLNLRPLLFLSESAKDDFRGMETNDPNSVVVGLAPTYFNYAEMNKAFKLLMNGAPLIAINKSRYYQTPNGLSLAAGPFVSALEFSSGCKATIVGKPSEEFFKKSVENFHVDLEDCVMIGDDVRDDIEGAIGIGMKGILVQTGKYLSGDENNIKPPPTAVTSCFAEATNLLINSINQT